jgi:pimeloyl-ACP methyl ester carboxylesterase
MVDGITKRTVARVGAALVFLTLAGATYQGVTTAFERREYPRPGGMVDVGGHQLHIYCSGEGSPTAILEAPAGGMSAAWGAVQPQVARVTRVCSYDRAGLGWSERPDGPYEPAAVVEQLRTLLDGAGERSPYIVAGQGLGAAFATLFASRFGRDTAALILVDAPPGGHPPAEPKLLTRLPAALPWLARTGVLRASGGLCSMTARLPQPSGGALCAFLNRPDHLSRTAEELSRWNDAVTPAAGARIPATIPTVRLDVFGHARVAFLAAAESSPVVTAILDAVHRARATTVPGAEDATPDAP